ncbi:MAG: hypothetical protein B6U73_04090 [Desulfurococcales archaeon ex4484_204]|nr:MAG: hypothetical protein B6U73_04090 [Desulfurococcales archaeon ex4484_204]
MLGVVYIMCVLGDRGFLGAFSLIAVALLSVLAPLTTVVSSGAEGAYGGRQPLGNVTIACVEGSCNWLKGYVESGGGRWDFAFGVSRQGIASYYVKAMGSWIRSRYYRASNILGWDMWVEGSINGEYFKYTSLVDYGEKIARKGRMGLWIPGMVEMGVWLPVGSIGGAGSIITFIASSSNQEFASALRSAAKVVGINKTSIIINGVNRTAYLVAAEDVKLGVINASRARVLVGEVVPNTYVPAVIELYDASINTLSGVMSTGRCRYVLQQFIYNNRKYVIGGEAVPVPTLRVLEEFYNPQGDLGRRPSSDANVSIVLRSGSEVRRWLFTTDSKGFIDGEVPWYNVTEDRFIPGTYHIRVSKRQEPQYSSLPTDVLERVDPFYTKYGGWEVYPVNMLTMEVDEGGNIEVVNDPKKTFSVVSAETFGPDVLITLRRVDTWDQFVRSNIEGFLRDVGVVTEPQISKVLSIKTYYGTGSDEYRAGFRFFTWWLTYGKINYMLRAIDQFRGAYGEVDLQTLYHEWGHGVKQVLLTDTGADLGGQHKSPGAPASSMELAYDEGHAEFFSYMLITYTGIGSDPYDDYQVGYTGPTPGNTLGNYIEGRIAGYWIKLYNIPKGSYNRSLVTTSYRDFLKTSLLYKKLVGHLPRTIDQWINAYVLRSGLVDAERAVGLANERGFKLPSLLISTTPDDILFYRATFSGKPAVLGRPLALLGEVRAVGKGGEVLTCTSRFWDCKDFLGVLIPGVGDRVEALANSKVLYVNGTSGEVLVEVDMGRGSVLTVSTPDRLKLVEGTVHVRTSKNNMVPVELSTIDFTIYIHSDVVLESTGSSGRLYVLEGSVVVEGPDKEVVTVPSNHYVTLNVSGVGRPEVFTNISKWWVEEGKVVPSVREHFMGVGVSSSGGVVNPKASFNLDEDESMVSLITIDNPGRNHTATWYFKCENGFEEVVSREIREDTDRLWAYVNLSSIDPRYLGYGGWVVKVYIDDRLEVVEEISVTGSVAIPAKVNTTYPPPVNSSEEYVMATKAAQVAVRGNESGSSRVIKEVATTTKEAATTKTSTTATTSTRVSEGVSKGLVTTNTKSKPLGNITNIVNSVKELTKTLMDMVKDMGVVAVVAGLLILAVVITAVAIARRK